MLNHATSSSDSLSSFKPAFITSDNLDANSLILNPIKDPPYYNTQSAVTLPSIQILEGVGYDIYQLDLTTSKPAPYYYTNSRSSQNTYDYRSYNVDNVSQSKSGIIKVQSGFLCDCCGKMPKKFETEEALNAHKAERKYNCTYCGSRFKNKSEADRHKKSIHVRSHSWSCAALPNYGAAFDVLDRCGYCGDEFQCSGQPALGSNVPTLTEGDHNVRIQHLLVVHKWRECNIMKKFFRLDHFRQHLKHSHAGKSGTWMNMVENACMKEEPLPEPIRGAEFVQVNSY